MITWNKMKTKHKKYTRSSTVELSKRNKSESSTPGQRHGWKRKIDWLRFLLITLLVIETTNLSAQDLINTGRINNTGTFRVKRQAEFGSQDTLSGIFDYFGANQIVPAKNYQDLVLSGSGTKQTSGGNFTVFGNITISPAVTLHVESGFVARMDGTLFEQGYLLGSIQKGNVDLSGDTVSSNFGNIGVSISWTGTAPGRTIATRTSGVALVGNNNESVKRYYDILPATNSGLNATVTLKYADSELNGHEPSKLLLWKSVDGGVTWRIQGGTVDTAARTMTKTGITSFGRYTFADSLHPLGSLTPVAGVLAAVSGNGQTERIFTTLQPFIVAVTDSDGHAVRNEPITFTIISTPENAVGQFLSDTLTRTDSSGVASSVLHLGSKVGVYTIAVSAPSIGGEPIIFTASATAGLPHTLALVSGNNQTAVVNSVLSQPFVVTVTDSGGNVVSGVKVQFAFVDTPSGSVGQQLAVSDSVTDSLGQVSALLTLGNKIGTYTVAATSAGLSGSPVTFIATAISGTARNLLAVSGNNQTGVVTSTLPLPFVVSITDSNGNPVTGTNVHFEITSAPSSAIGQRLSVIDTVSDSLGYASTVLTLGNKVGMYVVTVTSAGLNGSPLTFMASATVSSAGNLTIISGNNQTGIVGATLSEPFVVSITDTNGNPVAGVNVQFAVVDTPIGSVGHQLTVLNALSDSSGLASAMFKFGSKPGVYEINASSTGLAGSPARFFATASVGPAYRLAMNSGDNQTDTTNHILPQPFVVSVTDSFGNPVAGSQVRFAIVSKPAGAMNDSLTTTLSVTDSLGQARTFLRLGDKPGVYTVTATDSVLQGSPVIFTATAISTVAARLVEVSGNNQFDTVNTSLQNPFVVLVTDINGNPVSGTTVNFQITSAPNGATGQSLSVTSTISDSSGLASTILTLGQKVGLYVVSATSTGLSGSPIEFRATALPARARVIAQVSGDNQQAVILTQLAQPFIVTVSDSFGNFVPRAKVHFSITTTPAGAIGAVLSQDTVTADSIGQARTFLTIGNKVGTYVSTASLVDDGGEPVIFTSRAIPGVAAMMVLTSGNNQTQDISTQLALPFVVTVTDIGGNPVSGTEVRFAITTTPRGARGHSLSDTLAVSDSLGHAASYLTLSHKYGTHTVTATSTGLSGSPVVFAANATAFLADANGDGRANIADLTTVIDKVDGRIILSDANFTRADVDTNDVIDNRDESLILGGILDGKWDSLSLIEPTIESTNAAYEAKFEVTKNGLRFNLKNDAPVKGVQFAIRFRSTTTIDRPDVVFKRGKHMNIPMQAAGNILRVVMYHDDNVPIDTGNNSLLRLATKNLALGDFDIEYVIISTEANEGLYIPFTKADGSGNYPDSYALLQNFPNPFNNQTTLRFQVPDVPGRFAPVLLQIFSVDGERIRTLVKGDFEAGTYDYQWDGTNDNGQVVSTGMYLYRLWTKDLMLVKKMMFIK